MKHYWCIYIYYSYYAILPYRSLQEALLGHHHHKLRDIGHCLHRPAKDMDSSRMSAHHNQTSQSGTATQVNTSCRLVQHMDTHLMGSRTHSMESPVTSRNLSLGRIHQDLMMLMMKQTVLHCPMELNGTQPCLNKTLIPVGQQHKPLHGVRLPEQSTETLSSPNFHIVVQALWVVMLGHGQM